MHERIYDRFIEQMTAAAERIKVGAGMEADTSMGPLANARRVQSMERLMQDAREHGATITTGGNRIDGPGFFFQPTVVSNVSQDCALMNEEPFGPVVVAAPFSDDDAVIAQANRLPMGLGGFVYTQNARRIRRLSAELEVGMLGVNNCLITFAESPFGGVKESGYGSEGGVEGIESHLVTKFVHQI